MTTPESRTVETFAFVIWDALSDRGVLRIDADSPKELHDVTRSILAAAKEHGLVIGEGERLIAAERARLRDEIMKLPAWDRRSVPGGLHVNRASVLVLLEESPAGR